MTMTGSSPTSSRSPGSWTTPIVIALVVRSVLRSGGPELVREHWRGPQRSLDALLRLA
jgi:hypothetical protein